MLVVEVSQLISDESNYQSSSKFLKHQISVSVIKTLKTVLKTVCFTQKCWVQCFI